MVSNEEWACFKFKNNDIEGFDFCHWHEDKQIYISINRDRVCTYCRKSPPTNILIQINILDKELATNVGVCSYDKSGNYIGNWMTLLRKGINVLDSDIL